MKLIRYCLIILKLLSPEVHGNVLVWNNVKTPTGLLDLYPLEEVPCFSETICALMAAKRPNVSWLRYELGVCYLSPIKIAVTRDESKNIGPVIIGKTVIADGCSQDPPLDIFKPGHVDEEELGIFENVSSEKEVCKICMGSDIWSYPLVQPFDQSSVASCSPPFVQTPYGCLEFVEIRSSYCSAAQACLDRGATLAQLTNVINETDIRALANSMGLDGFMDAWIGGRYNGANFIFFSSGKVQENNSTVWHEVERDYHVIGDDPNGNCLKLTFDPDENEFGFRDSYCDDGEKFLCEKLVQ